MKPGTSPHCQYHSVDLVWDQRPIWHCRRSLHLSRRKQIISHSCWLLICITLQIQQSSICRTRGRVSHVPRPLLPFSSAQKSWDWPLLKFKLKQHDVGCTISSQPSLACCGCTTSFWRFFEWSPMLICSNTPRQFVIPYQDSATSCCASLHSPCMRLRRKHRPVWCSWSVVPAVCWSSFATQRRQCSRKVHTL